ncbi:MAG: leucine-rich repeat protein [Clostridia bacterium]|nr:leucine-rich repeat protein [Clostridia bacterium]
MKAEITAVVVGDNVTKIGVGAFAYCANLESITFGKNVTALAQDAMAYCPKLHTIFFGATITEVGQGTVWTNDALADITLTGQSRDEFLAVALVHAYNTPYESEDISWHTNCAHVPVTDAAVPPTCEGTGLTEGSHCSLCGDVFKAQTVVPSTGHIYDDASSCTGCGQDEPITWTLEDGVLTVRGKGAIVPEDTETVTYPWNAQKSMIREIVVTGGITEVGARAFSNCDNLVKITFGKYVSVLDNDVVSYCPALSEIVFEETITSLGQGTVWGSENITSITLTEQSVSSFLALAAARTYNTPYNSESIVWTINCAHDEKQTDPALAASCTDCGVTEGIRCATCDTVIAAQEVIPALGGSHTFSGGKCTKCGIAKGYTWAISGGTLYIRGTGAVTANSAAEYPWNSRSAEITAVVVGDGITEIGAWAFTRFSALKSVTFSKNVTKFGQDTMSYCGSLTEIAFCGPVTYIGQGIVWGTNNIKKVTITGQTKEAFLAVATTYSYNGNFESESIVWTIN